MACYKLEPQLYIVKDEAIAHGVCQSMFAYVSTGDINFSTFAAAALSSGAMSGLGSVPGFEEFSKTLGGSMAVGFTMGGLGSLATGGDFWSGAATGVLVAVANHYMHDGNGGDEKKALKYKEKYDDAKITQMAETVLSEGILETTTPGKLLTVVREKLVNIYGSENTKTINKVYSKVISTIKSYKSSLGSQNAKVWDPAVAKIASTMQIHCVVLEVQKAYYIYRIENLSMNVYNRIFLSNHSGFSGGGAKGNW